MSLRTGERVLAGGALILLGVAVAALGARAGWELWPAVAAAVVILLGVGFLLAALPVRARPGPAVVLLVAVPLLLVVALDVVPLPEEVGPIPVGREIGRNQITPAGGQLEGRYRQAVGQLTIDLSEFELPAEGAELHAAVGSGQLTVVVPPQATVTVDASVVAGQISALGQARLGVGQDLELRVVGDPSQLVVNATVGLGRIQVRR